MFLPGVKSAFLTVVSLPVVTGALAGTEIPIANPGFESPAHVDGGFSVGIPSWTVFGGVGHGGGTYNPTTTSYAAEAPAGDNVGWLVTLNSALMTQSLADSFVAGNTYTLSALVGDPDNRTGGMYELVLLADDVSVAATGALPIPAEGAFTRVEISFDADASREGQTIGIALYAWPGTEIDPDEDPGQSGSQVDYDDVRLEFEPTAAQGAGAVSGLLVGKNTNGDVLLDWQPSCSTDDDDYAVYGGDLGDFASHSFETCGTGGTTSATILQPAGNRYYLVVPLDGSEEGSYGTDGDGGERPVGIVTCETRTVPPTCP